MFPWNFLISRTRRLFLHTLILTLAFPQPLFANPVDGQVRSGAAVITHTDKKTDIHQSTGRAVIDWRSFDIAPDEHTQFHQPDARSVTLNRVTDGNPSAIAGKLSANGHIILINPNGVFFQGSSRVDVSGLIASTADIDNSDFMAGRMNFSKPGDPDAAIINDGMISAHNAGLVGLVAPNVINNGVIQADLGRIHLASGDMATVDLYGDGLMEIAVSDKVTSQIVANNGILAAKGGKIAMTAAAGRDVVNSLISVRGELRAPAVAEKNGEIYIYAAGSNKTAKTGSSAVTAQAYLDVSGMDAGERGGKISISGDHVALLDGTVMDASGWSGRTGTTDGLAASAKRGGSAGGEILIGGDYLGQGSLATAKTLHVGAATIFFNDAVKEGDAGRTIFWSDGDTYFAGNVFARGGALGGNGGFLETSGHETLQASGFADLTAVNGKKGTYFLDPANIAIYGNVDPNFVSTDGGINLASILEFWIDPTDAARITLLFSADAMSSATATGAIGSNTLTTSVNVAASLGVGAKIRLGGVNGYTALASDASDADTYTIAAISGTTITTGEALRETYVPTPVYRGLITAIDDKSANDNDATRVGSTGMPLWLEDVQNGNSVINLNGLGLRYLSLPATGVVNNFDVWTVAQTGVTHQIDGQSTSGTLGIAGQNYILGPIQSGTDGGAGLSMGTNGISVYEHGAAYMPSVNTYSAAIGSGYQIVGVNYVAKRSKIFLNNVDVHTGVTSTKPNVQMNFAIGAANYGSPVANIGDTFAYNANVSADARDLLDQYMSAKWGTALDPVAGAGTEAAEAMHVTNGYSVFTTDYLVRLSQTADISLQATTDITLDLDGDVMALQSGRSITLTAGNDIITRSSGEIVTSGAGNIFFSAGHNITLAHGLDLTASGSGSVTLRAGHDIASSGGGDITAQSGNIALHADFDGNNAGAISLGAGTALAAVNGDIDLISDGAAAVSFNNAGITAGDDVTIETGGSLTLGNISADTIFAQTKNAGADISIATGRTLAASGTGTAVTLVSADDFINNAGAGAIDADNGRFLVWSQDPGDDTRGGLLHAFRQYDADYGVTGVLGSGHGFLYALAPTLAISLTGAVRKTYNQSVAATLTAANYQISGGATGDTVTAAGLPVAGVYNTANAGTGKNVAVAGMAPTGFTDGAVTLYGYQYNTAANANIGAILQRGIQVTAHDIIKDYGDADPALTYGYSGVLGGDSVVFTGSLARAAGEGGGTYAISQGSLALAAGNYAIDNFTAGIFEIDRIIIPDTVLIVSQDSQITATVTAGNANAKKPDYFFNLPPEKSWQRLTDSLVRMHPLLAARLGLEDGGIN